MQINSLTYSLT